MTLHFLKMTAEKYYEYDLLLLPGIYQVNLIDPGFYSSFYKQDFYFQISLSHIFHLLYNSAKPTDNYSQIFANPIQTTTIRFLPNPPRRLQSDFCQTHPDDYNQIFTKPTQTTTIRLLPTPPRRLQSNFYQTHPDDYNQIFANPCVGLVKIWL
jgi:hypothetical protein